MCCGVRGLSVKTDFPDAVHRSKSARGFALMELGEMILFSVYISPNSSNDYFEEVVEALSREVRPSQKPLLISW